MSKLTAEQLKDIRERKPSPYNQGLVVLSIAERDALLSGREELEQQSYKRGFEEGRVWYRREYEASESRREELERDSAILHKSGIVEIAVRNTSVSDYTEHWEGRALKAEAKVTELERKVLMYQETEATKIADLEQRVDSARNGDILARAWGQDVCSFIVAEVERLTSENDRLRTTGQSTADGRKEK